MHLLRVLGVRAARKVFLTPAKDIEVLRAFPPAVSTAESSPFLFVDLFETVSNGEISDVDTFPMPWHPHYGHDVVTYLTSGRGRHADSMGNRGTFDAPGMQWLHAGAGIEHTEGGGTPLGDVESGVQLWINVPKALKTRMPEYGSASATQIPVLPTNDGVCARLLAGELEGAHGPFTTHQPLLMVDVDVPASAAWSLDIPAHLDTAMCVVHRGSARVNEAAAAAPCTVLLDAASGQQGPTTSKAPGRRLSISTGQDGDGARVLLLAGARIHDPVHWRGTFVAASPEELRAVEEAHHSHDFPPASARAAWDYKRLAAFPISHPARLSCGQGDVAYSATAGPGDERGIAPSPSAPSPGPGSQKARDPAMEAHAVTIH
jgi:quercetin 2,3-dioxygenase